MASQANPVYCGGSSDFYAGERAGSYGAFPVSMHGFNGEYALLVYARNLVVQLSLHVSDATRANYSSGLFPSLVSSMQLLLCSRNSRDWSDKVVPLVWIIVFQIKTNSVSFVTCADRGFNLNSIHPTKTLPLYAYQYHLLMMFHRKRKNPNGQDAVDALKR